MLLLASLSTPHAYGCAEVVPEHKTPLQIAEETALIIYDDKTKTEEFIRQAVFNPKTQDAKDFGFLVPTPTPPTLTVTNSKLLPQVNEATKPRVYYRMELSFFGFPLPSAREMNTGTTKSIAADTADTWVAVQEQRVGNLDAAILQASDAKALRKWMSDHGYASRPALEKWLDSYVKRGWTITAFKVVQDSTVTSTANTTILTPVRMTFHTDHPFYPYREPGDSPKDTAASRTLRILYIGPAFVFGKLSADRHGIAPQQEEDWHTTLDLARILTEPQRQEIVRLARMAPGETIGGHLSVFQEMGSNRPLDKDLYFVAAPTMKPWDYQHTYETRYYDIAPWLIGIFLLPAGLLYLRKRRREQLA